MQRKDKNQAKVLMDLEATLAAKPANLTVIATQKFASQPLNRSDAAAARAMLWRAHVDILRKKCSKEIEMRLITEDKLEMPFYYKIFGDKPAGGRSLWISLHGGGGTTKKDNDSQWENQKKLYEVKEGIYLAPRAPTNTWDLWHQDHIDRMLGRLIENLIVMEDVNPDRVYVLGYSAGYDGVYQIAPRMADRWAGAAMMAGHPNKVSLLALRNVPFALQVGAKDCEYNRNLVGREYGDILAKLHKNDPHGYENFVKIHEGKGHWMDLEDKIALPWLAKFTRNATPQRIVWKQTGVSHERSYWLAVPEKQKKLHTLVSVDRDGQTIRITEAENVQTLIIRFDDRIADLDRPITVTHAGKTLYTGMLARTIAVICKTLEGRGDPKLMFDAEVSVELPQRK